jgi:uncharacterized protein (DUF1697 family)
VRQVILLRGVNVGARNRLPMAALRELLEQAGMSAVSTYVQSGNVVLDSDLPASQLASRCESLIADRFGLQVGAVVRTRAQLARVLRRDPLGELATEPKLYQVSFCAGKPSAAALKRIAAVAVEGERLEAHGSEIYAWFPHGIGRSRLAAQLAGPGLGVLATARNWTTVTKLLELAER